MIASYLGKNETEPTEIRILRYESKYETTELEETPALGTQN